MTPLPQLNALHALGVTYILYALVLLTSFVINLYWLFFIGMNTNNVPHVLIALFSIFNVPVGVIHALGLIVGSW